MFGDIFALGFSSTLILAHTAQPAGYASWASLSIAQPYFPALNINHYLTSTPNVSTYSKNMGWYKVHKPVALWSRAAKSSDVWTKIVKTKISSG